VLERDGEEYSSSHLEDAQHFALDFINEHMNEVSKDKYLIHCAGGYKCYCCFHLKAGGFHDLVDIGGGFDDIKNTDLPMTNFV
jgi:rhodanese-related sulfurtransferase